MPHHLNGILRDVAQTLVSTHLTVGLEMPHS